VKPWAKRIQLFLGEKRKLFFHFWSKRGRGKKEEGHFWVKRVPPRKHSFFKSNFIVNIVVSTAGSLLLAPCLNTQILFMHMRIGL
jgi:hypothetical protein